MRRHKATTPELDAREKEWWSANGDLEESFSWVQSPMAQRIVRGGYVHRMSRSIPPGSTIVEYGCGTGWLSRWLAELGDHRVFGTDLSADQIARAQEAAPAARRERLSYAVAGSADMVGWPDRFDAAVMHAFLHHLSVAELEQVLADAHARLRQGGILVALEPVHLVTGEEARTRAGHIPELLNVMRQIPRRMGERRFRRMSPLEVQTRIRIYQRELPEAPFGPSPKEVPFEPGDLEQLFTGAGFAVTTVEPVLSMSHLVAEEVMLAQLSQPRLWALIGPVLMLAARLADRRLVKTGPAVPGSWVFNLYFCRRDR